MSVKDNKETIIKILESLFGKEDKISFYFLKKGKKVLNNETIIPFKTRRNVDSILIRDLEKNLRKETGESDISLSVGVRS